MNGFVTDVNRMAINDGDGLRTTLFMKGCPLCCVWYHKSESSTAQPQLLYIQSKCQNCGLCSQGCPAHTLQQDGHHFDRENCSGCGTCVPQCPNGALIWQCMKMSVEMATNIVLEDRVFYEFAGGGVTISSEYHFVSKSQRNLQKHSISTAVDTSGYSTRHAIEAILPNTDVFLYDIKYIDENLYLQFTGQSNRVILIYLQLLDTHNTPVEIRIPFLPGKNEHEIDAIGLFLSTMQCMQKAKVLPYHSTAKSKNESLGMTYSLNPEIPTDEVIERAVPLFCTYGLAAFNGNRI